MANFFNNLVNKIPFRRQQSEPLLGTDVEDQQTDPSNQASEKQSVAIPDETVSADEVVAKFSPLPDHLTVSSLRRDSQYYYDLLQRSFLSGALEVDPAGLAAFVEGTNNRHKIVKQLDRLQPGIRQLQPLAAREIELSGKVVPAIAGKEIRLKHLTAQVSQEQQNVADRQVEVNKAHEALEPFSRTERFGNWTSNWLYAIAAGICIVIDVLMLRSYFHESLNKGETEAWTLSAAIASAAVIGKVIYENLFDGHIYTHPDFQRKNKGFMWALGGLLVVVLLTFGLSRGFSTYHDNQVAAQKKQESSQSNQGSDTEDLEATAEPETITPPTEPTTNTPTSFTAQDYSFMFGGAMMSLILLLSTAGGAVMLSKSFKSVRQKVLFEELNETKSKAELQLDLQKAALFKAQSELISLEAEIVAEKAEAEQFLKKGFNNQYQQLLVKEVELLTQLVSIENTIDKGLLQYFNAIGKRFEVQGSLELGHELAFRYFLDETGLDRYDAPDQDDDYPAAGGRSGNGPRGGNGQRTRGNGNGSYTGSPGNYNYGQRPHQRIRKLISEL